MVTRSLHETSSPNSNSSLSTLFFRFWLSVSSRTGISPSYWKREVNINRLTWQTSYFPKFRRRESLITSGLELLQRCTKEVIRLTFYEAIMPQLTFDPQALYIASVILDSREFHPNLIPVSLRELSHQIRTHLNRSELRCSSKWNPGTKANHDFMSRMLTQLSNKLTPDRMQTFYTRAIENPARMSYARGTQHSELFIIYLSEEYSPNCHSVFANRNRRTEPV